MVTSVTPVLEQQHMPRAQARAGGQDAYVRFDFVGYMDSSTSTTQLAKQTPDQSHVAARNRAGEYCCNQQYSVTAITTSTGTIAERYAYSAYGQPTILDASGSILNASAISNRYTYTGREWDATLGLHHFRARWMSPSAGRFLGRDPIGYWDSNDFYVYALSSPNRFVDPSGLTCQPEQHHWFPQSYRGPIESRCSSIGFRIDYFTSPLNRCWDQDKNCSVHGWIHGNNIPNRPIRSPDWNTEVGQILNGTGTCCAFLIEMAAAIAVAYADIADEFADCNQPKCYKLETFRPPVHPEARPRPDTTRLFSDIISACRRGLEPDKLPSNVNQDGGGLGDDPTIDILVGGGAGLFPKAFPKVFPRLLPKAIPKEPVKKFPEYIPRRKAA